MFIKVYSLNFKLGPFNGADVAYVLSYILFYVVMFSQGLEGIDYNPVDNVKHNQNNSKEE